MADHQHKYLLIPGFVISKIDGQEHRITAWQLADLYGVRASECRLYRNGDPIMDDLIILRPRRDGDYTIPPASGARRSRDNAPEDLPMTTSVVITPAGHHVRVTPIYPDGPPPGQGAPIELAPGDAPHTLYIHNGLSLKVEEFDPAAAEEPHDEISSDDGDYEASKA